MIISYDSDGAGQAATLRGLEILTNVGCDVRILQMEGAKDPDEYVIKYGNGRFNDLVENAISLVEFKIKVLKKGLNIENTNDKIKFMNEIAKILGGVENKIEQEIYIDKISRDYNISKEAIYAQINKNEYSKNKGSKILESATARKPILKEQKAQINPELEKRENIIISLLLEGKEEVYNKIKDIINPNDFKNEANQKIMRKLYEELEKGNSNINNIIDIFADDEQVVNSLTGIMADDYEIEDNKKALEDVINNYQKEKLIARRNEIIHNLNDANLDKQKASELEKELHTLIIKLAQIK